MATYSIILLAVVDSDYKFVVVDVGAYGKQSDGGVLQQSAFGQLLEQGRLELPKDLPLPSTRIPAPCVFMGDEAFQLRPDFLRPYPGRGLTATNGSLTTASAEQGEMS
ncbi:protein ALP1-like [Ixodes scapularis]